LPYQLPAYSISSRPSRALGPLPAVVSGLSNVENSTSPASKGATFSDNLNINSFSSNHLPAYRKAAGLAGRSAIMKKLRILVSLTTNDNDYQIEQAKSAAEAARRLNLDCSVTYAENDAINQSTQLLRAIQAAPQDRPDAIVFEPVGGTALPQVARAAATANIGWAVLNREASYISELRRTSKAAIFCVSNDHVEIGRIQARQFAALLPKGGNVLYIQGPSENSAAKERAQGMLSLKPANIQVITLKGQWTEESSTRAVRSWLKLSTSQKIPVDLVGAQDDAMAMGARKAFQEITNESERDRWLKLPFTGCDGLPSTGQTWVRTGQLAATVFAPPNAGQAIEMIFHAITKGQEVPERVLTAPSSFPSINELKPKAS
jgi:ribose transport system substrate-binding protein